MSNTPNTGIPELSATAANQAVVVNSGYAIIDVLLDRSVKSKSTSAPPVSPTDGDAYIVPSGASGVWSSQVDKIAYWRSSAGAWQYLAPKSGWIIRVRDDLDTNGVPKQAAYDGSAWTVPADGGTFTGGTLVSALNEAPQVTLASASTVNIGAASANTVNVTGTTTITAFDSIAAGAKRTVVFQGALTLTYNATSMILPTASSIITAAGDVAVFESLGSGNWRCNLYSRASGQALTGSGGLSNWTDAKSTSAPNATIPVVSLTATSSETNIDAAIIPKGTGALLARVPNGSASGGNKRGTNAVDLQVSSTVASRVASGNYSFIGGGQENTASSIRSVVVGGNANTASGGNDVVVGGNSNSSTGGQNFIGSGQSNSAAGAYNSIVGGSSNSIGSGSYGFIGGGSSNTFSGAGDYRSSLGGLSNTTSGSYSSVLGGRNNTANADYSICLGGAYSTTKGIVGAVVHSSGRFSSDGDAQYGRYLFRAQTTNATATDLTADGTGTVSASSVLVLGGQNAYLIRGRVVARNTSTGELYAWDITALARRTNLASTTALVGTPTVTAIGGDSALSSAAITLYVNSTLGAIVLSVTGIAATTIRWLAEISTVEVG